jgi:hypothetical protein
VGLKDLGGAYAILDPVGEFRICHVLDGVQVQNVSQRLVVGKLLGQRPTLHQHGARRRVVTAQAEDPADGGQHPGAIRVWKVAKRGKPALSHRHRVAPPSSPGQMLGHGPAQPPERVGLAKPLVQEEGLVHGRQGLVPAADAS